MNTFDDSDMKIFGVKESPDVSDGAEVQALAQEMKRQRLNGNSERAKQLGIRLAALAPDSADEDSLDLIRLLGDPLPATEIMCQIRILLIFTAESCLHLYTPTPLLATTAVNALYDKLIEDDPGFYDTISNGAAFSFYYLALRHSGKTDENIGMTFAMLCGEEHDAALIQLGERVYQYVTRKVREIIDGIQFAEPH
uniref:hypothetical protein n=1 Tax=Candidatus Fimivicinus sp. TaxID=3056640 RepID=UPI003FF09789